jgi:hypothetical protein
MLVKTLLATAFMLLPYNLDYLTVMVTITSWLAWKVEGGRTSKRTIAGAVGNHDLTSPNRLPRSCDGGLHSWRAITLARLVLTGCSVRS